MSSKVLKKRYVKIKQTVQFHADWGAWWLDFSSKYFNMYCDSQTWVFNMDIGRIGDTNYFRLEIDFSAAKVSFSNAVQHLLYSWQRFSRGPKWAIGAKLYIPGRARRVTIQKIRGGGAETSYFYFYGKTKRTAITEERLQHFLMRQQTLAEEAR